LEELLPWWCYRGRLFSEKLSNSDLNTRRNKGETEEGANRSQYKKIFKSFTSEFDSIQSPEERQSHLGLMERIF
jgi:hypothetical protein